jgi:adenosylcobinamide-phosphate synthase
MNTLAAATTAANALTLALVLDHFLGEPARRWHPVVWMGCYLAWAQQLAAPPANRPLGGTHGIDWQSFGWGAGLWLAGAALTLVVCALVQTALMELPVLLAAPALAALLKPLLAWRMLRDEVLAVETALGQSLVAGRERLRLLVSRDVDQLAAHEVRESAIESLAENLNDSVISPIFWFVVAGLPGAALYRFANTADAMWGYRGERSGYVLEWFGKWAARADDVLSWPGARITAMLVGVVVVLRVWPQQPAAKPRGWAWISGMARVKAQAGRTPSPNSGWPMAAFALALHIRLSKPGVYALNPDAPAPCSADVRQSTNLANKVLLAGLYVALLAIFFVAFAMRYL